MAPFFLFLDVTICSERFTRLAAVNSDELAEKDLLTFLNAVEFVHWELESN